MNTGGTAGPGGPRRSRPKAGAQEAAGAHGGSEAQKASAAQGKARIDDTGGVIHGSEAGQKTAVPASAAFDQPPVLAAPSMALTAPEYQTAAKTTRDKMGQPVDQKQMAAVHKKKLAGKKAAIEEAGQQVAQLSEDLKSGKISQTKAELEAAKIIFKLTQLGIKIGGNFAKILAGRQAEAVQKNRTETIKQKQSMEKEKKAGGWSKAFKWIGAIAGVVISLVSVVAAKVLTVVTFGAAAPLVGLAYFGLAASVMGLAVMILDETGALDKFATAVVAPILEKMGVENPEMVAKMVVGVLIAVIQIAIAVVGITRMNAAAFANIPQQALQMFNRIMITGQQVMQLAATAGKATADIVGAVAKKEVAESEAKKTENQKVISELDFAREDQTMRIQQFLDFMNKMIKMASEGVQGKTQAISGIFGRMA